MFARITPFKMKAGSREAASATLEEMKADVLALPGLVSFHCAMNDDGSGYVVSIVESKELSDANADRVRALWGRMAEYLEAMPVPEGYDVVASWTT